VPDLSALFLSIIIPAFNEEVRLPGTLEQVLSFCSAKEYRSEILVVENGSCDRTFQIAKEFAGKYSNVFAYHESLPGKGRAVKRGMLEARGEFRFMCDADLSMPIEQLDRFLPPCLEHFDIAIASREAPGAVRYEEPNYRHIGGRAINTLIRTFALPGLHDTQCGFKCFRAITAEDLFGKLTMTGWSFDIELLYIARLRDYRIVEIPVPWYFNPDSKVSVVRDALKMIGDIFVIRRNATRGVYDPLIE
jgi:glycosyltransferase involved in cell wall biosynthesis